MQPKTVYLILCVLICTLISGSQIASAQVSSKKQKKETKELILKANLKPHKVPVAGKTKVIDRGISEIITQSKQGVDWVDSNKSVFSYLEDRLLIEEEVYIFQDENWVHFGNINFSYMEGGKLTSIVNTDTNGEVKYATYLFYNQEGRLDSAKYEEDGINDEITELVYHTPDSITFIFDGVPDTLSYLVFKDGDLHEVYAYEDYIDRYIYYDIDMDGYIRQISDVFYFVDIYNDELYSEEIGFEPYSRLTHQKENGLVTQQLEEYYDDETKNWNPEYRTDYMYDGSIIIESKVSYYFQAWNEEYRSFYSYDNTVSNEPEETINSFVLYQNYPNPFNPSTTVSFNLESSANISLTVYNILGKKVSELYSGPKSSGRHQINFDASSLPSGIYYYELVAQNFRQTKSMVLLK
tara:strand:+ start:17610 stop:18836 length:1227 start_codon:yes stop_codon:yes gene_type:complete